MKSLFICTMMLLASFIANATEPIKTMTDKYDGQKGFMISTVEKNILQMVQQMPGLPEDQKKLYAQTDKIDVLIYKGKAPMIESLYNEALGLYKAQPSIYTYTTQATEGKMTVTLFAIESGEKAKEISVVLKMNDAFQLMVLRGTYDKEAIGAASKPQKNMF